MAANVRPAAAIGLGHGLCGGKCGVTIKDGLFKNNPIMIQVLGICSCLAVTNRLANALVMGGALIFVTAMSNAFVSLVRSIMPRQTRMITEVAIIATFVIFFDQFLRAFDWNMSKQLGPYVGLIITNCIVMGRAEAFAAQNPPVVSFVDGAANGAGYAAALAVVAFFRELAGSGSILGHTVLSAGAYERNILFLMAPGAFFTVGFLIWVVNALKTRKTAEVRA